MAAGLGNTLALNQIPTLYHVGVVGNLSDGQLLESFLAGPEEAAQAGFAALVTARTGWCTCICQQILGNPDEAEDAFQATFLVLVHRAGSVRKRDSVACWLHGIAYRVARRSRADAARRRRHERRWAALKAVAHSDSPIEPECWPELHDELSRLPERPELSARSVVQAAVRHGTREAVAHAGVSATVTQLVRGVLRTMFFTTLSVGAATVVTIATLVACAGVLFQKTPDQGQKTIQAAPVQRAPAPACCEEQSRRLRARHRGSGVPAGEVPRREWVQVLEMLAARSRADPGIREDANSGVASIGTRKPEACGSSGRLRTSPFRCPASVPRVDGRSSQRTLTWSLTPSTV